MSRVETKLKVGARVVWQTTVENTDVHILLSAVVSQLPDAKGMGHVDNVKIHSIESEMGIVGNINVKAEAGPINFNDAGIKSLDEARYKK